MQSTYWDLELYLRLFLAGRTSGILFFSVPARFHFAAVITIISHLPKQTFHPCQSCIYKPAPLFCALHAYYTRNTPTRTHGAHFLKLVNVWWHTSIIGVSSTNHRKGQNMQGIHSGLNGVQGSIS